MFSCWSDSGGGFCGRSRGGWENGWLGRIQACRVMDSSTVGKGTPVRADARVVSPRASAVAMLGKKESGHPGKAVIPAGLPKFTEVRGRGFREVFARIHERDQLSEAFLATGSCSIPRRLSGRAMGPRQPRQAAGRGSFPRFGPVEFKVVRRCRGRRRLPETLASAGDGARSRLRVRVHASQTSFAERNLDTAPCSAGRSCRRKQPPSHRAEHPISW